MRLIDADVVMEELGATCFAKRTGDGELIALFGIDEYAKMRAKEPHTGHWRDNGIFLPQCSECGGYAFGYHAFDAIKTDFCPNCGADMRGDKHE